jgi:5'-3' exonuclease
MSIKTALVIDGMNFFHRARSGFTLGPAPLLFNFMRNIRSLIEFTNPTNVFLVLEGNPIDKKNIFSEYKANRKVAVGTQEYEEKKIFHDRVSEIIDLIVSSNLPIQIIKHPDYECDDVIYHFIRLSEFENYIVVSNDSDFTQLLNEFKNVKIWNPMKKCWVEQPLYDYVVWKSIRGDASDNIPGLPGINDFLAEELASCSEKFLNFINSDITKKNEFCRNYRLIKFCEPTTSLDYFNQNDISQITKWDIINETFVKYGFKSILEPKAYSKFVNTFDLIKR